MCECDQKIVECWTKISKEPPSLRLKCNQTKTTTPVPNAPAPVPNKPSRSGKKPKKQIWIQICFFGFLPLLLGLLGTGAGALGTGVVVFVWLHLSLKLGGSFEILVQHSTIFWSHSHNALPHGLSTIFAIFCKNFNF